MIEDKRLPVQMWAVRHIFGAIMCYPEREEAESALRNSVSYDEIGPVTIHFGHESAEPGWRDKW